MERRFPRYDFIQHNTIPSIPKDDFKIDRSLQCEMVSNSADRSNIITRKADLPLSKASKIHFILVQIGSVVDMLFSLLTKQVKGQNDSLLVGHQTPTRPLPNSAFHVCLLGWESRVHRMYGSSNSCTFTS